MLGIVEKLDYLQALGIDIIWLCPIYETEFKDAGYDVLDYFQIWKSFGTLEDFQALVSAAKERNIEIMLDIVLNHTSTNHAWFQTALKDANSPEFNYYIWTTQPNQAQSIFGGSAWEYVPANKQYYFHLFAKEQVDLNWKNAQTRTAMASVIDFWYKLGIKYFRLDAIQHVCKQYVEDKLIDSFGDQMVPWLQAFIDQAFANKPDAYIIGEASGITAKKALEYGVGQNKIADCFYNFSWWWIGWSKKTGRNGYDSNWSIKDFVNEEALEYQNNPDIFPGLMVNFLSNHDTARAISRWGNEAWFWKEAAKSLVMFQFILKGGQVIYYGEEIGMLNPGFKNRSEFRDVDVYNSFALLVDQQKIYSESDMVRFHNINSRDNCRTPMQWDLSTNYGFNKGCDPWIKLGKHTHPTTVIEQINDPDSIWSFYQKIIKLRKNSLYKNLLVDGSSKMSFEANNLIQVVRTYDQKKIIGLINIRPHEIEIAKKIFTKRLYYALTTIINRLNSNYDRMNQFDWLQKIHKILNLSKIFLAKKAY